MPRSVCYFSVISVFIMLLNGIWLSNLSFLYVKLVKQNPFLCTECTWTL